MDGDALTLAPGIYPGIPAADYHAAKHIVSKSHLDRLARSPLHYQHYLSAPAEQSRQMVIGSALHVAVLEPELFASQYTATPADAPRDLRYLRHAKKPSAETLDSIAWWDAFDARGATILTTEEMLQVQGMRAAIAAHDLARAALVGPRELTVVAAEPETGVLCKVRLDCWNAPLRLIADIKTCADASPRAFERSCANYRYHVQAALYLAICQAAGLDAETFAFVAVESAPPHAVMVYELDVESLVAGMTQAQRDLRRLLECRATGLYPAYSTKPMVLSIPEWSKSA